MNARLFIWLLLAVPALLLLVTQSDLMQLTAHSGTVAAHLITLALAITPLVRLARGARWSKFLLAHRRAIGVAAFAYALLHLAAYLLDMGLDIARAEFWLPAIWTGWLSFLLLAGLAAISNGRSQRRLGKHWKRLQRLAYAAALLGLAHWLLVHDSQAMALAHVLVLLLLQISRIIPVERKTAHD